jgi:cell fate (sporulation/competence/biofilm development) regulator YmcA (YheA/YmcA/DUF963 family)
MVTLFRHDGHHNSGHQMKHYNTRDLLIREDIIAKAKQLAELLGQSEEADIYRKAERQVNEHPEIQRIIAAIKKKQKEIVAFETTFKNQDMVIKIEKEIDQLQHQLDEFPIVTQFKQTQEDLNYILQLIVNIIHDTLSEQIQVETGTKVGSSSNNCSD